jgi:hypothetical protein
MNRDAGYSGAQLTSADADELERLVRRKGGVGAGAVSAQNARIVCESVTAVASHHRYFYTMNSYVLYTRNTTPIDIPARDILNIFWRA